MQTPPPLLFGQIGCFRRKAENAEGKSSGKFQRETGRPGAARSPICGMPCDSAAFVFCLVQGGFKIQDWRKSLSSRPQDVGNAMTLKADYLVKGCGATAMAFVDVMLRETDKSFVMVDKRAAPGGHWNDAYPFVRLHQPSSCYGVASRQLGRERKDETGFNKGLLELATGVEVTDYFHQVMRDEFLPSGRVNYHPVSEIVSEDVGAKKAEFVSLLSGRRHQVELNNRLVDGTMIATAIPLTHTRKFAVADGVACIPPNDLTRLAPSYRRFTVLGGGKTALDSLLWLLANGAAPETISWVLPRDPWLVNRAMMQPGLEFFEPSLGGMAAQYEIAATAASVRDFCERMEDAALWLRLDPAVWPTMMHAATVTVLELQQLRRITNVIRKGRLQRIEAEKLVLDGGESPAEPLALYVDCTAAGLGRNVELSPVFSPGLIRLQMIRSYQPTFSAALIGHVEATIDEEAEKQSLTRVTPMTDTAEDYVRMMASSIANQGAWMRRDRLREWIRNCRLDLYGKTLALVRENDTEKLSILGRLTANARPAIENLNRLAQLA